MRIKYLVILLCIYLCKGFVVKYLMYEAPWSGYRDVVTHSITRTRQCRQIPNLLSPHNKLREQPDSLQQLITWSRTKCKIKYIQYTYIDSRYWIANFHVVILDPPVNPSNFPSPSRTFLSPALALLFISSRPSHSKFIMTRNK